MAAKAIGLVCPPPSGVHSGGHVFNREVLACATRCGTPITALSGRPDELQARDWDLLVWDSLMLDRVERAGRERIAVLLHFVPSLEPGLADADRERLHEIEEHAAARADAIVTTARELADAAAARWAGKRVFVCEPGVGAAFCRRPARAARAIPMLLSVANLLPAKGHAGLLRVLHRLREQPWQWHVVGDGGPAAQAAQRLREQAERLGLAARIVLHGPLAQARVAALMAQADLLLHPSSFESYAMVLAEARATGLPAVSFDVGAARRLIEHGATGLVAAPGDWSGFERCLQSLLQNPRLRSAFERNLAHAPVRRWSETCADFGAMCEALLRAA